MNSRRGLIASLLLNAALGLLAWQLSRVEPPVARAASHSPLPTRVRRLPVEPVVPPRTPATAPANAVSNAEVAMAAFHWSQVESDDYERYVANLRAIGCPEQTMRDIIHADVDELYFRQFRDVVRPVSQKYWDILAGGADNHPLLKAAEAQMDKLEKEREKLIEKLLSTSDREVQEPPVRVTKYEADLGNLLAPEHKQQIAEIEARYKPLLAAVPKDSPDRKRIFDELRAQCEAEQFAALSPEEQTEWRMRDSRFAGKRNLMSSTITADELREIAALQAQAGKTNENSQQINDRIRGIIGEERFTDYKRSEDSDYQSLVRVGRRLELPTATLIRADDIRRAAQAQAERVEANEQFSPEQKSAVRAAIHRETTQALAGELGERGLRAYQRNGGNWIERLAKP